MANIFDDHAKKLLQTNQKLLVQVMNDNILPVDKKVSALNVLVNNAQVIKSLS